MSEQIIRGELESLIASDKRESSTLWLYVLFFFSGFPALIYQIVWQRALFAIYGVNVESVTVVVSAFMLGLGLGSLAGGSLSKRKGMPLLAVFGLVELGTAAFGVVSLRLFHLVASFTAGVPVIETGLVAFILVVIPTVFMGSTLPLLAAHMVGKSRNVGRSVGILYFVNTLGSSVACYAAAKVVLRSLGEFGSAAFAASINASIGIAVLVLYFIHRRGGAVSVVENSRVSELLEHASNSPSLLGFPVAMMVAGLAGFISLSYEVVWYRVYSFTSGGEAKSFAYLLGAFLAGIAFGSLFSRRLCTETGSGNKQKYIRFIALFVISANLIGFLVTPLVAFAVHFIIYTHTLPIVTLAAGLLGAVFPLICHVAIAPDSKAGAGLSYLYLSNIIGSTLGSFLVGFVLMDVLRLRQIAVVLALLGLALGTVLLATSGIKGSRLLVTLGSSLAVGVLIVVSAPLLFGRIYEHLQQDSGGDYKQGTPFRSVVETKSGIITVTQDASIFGGGIYDGKFSTDLINDRNIIIRPYALSLFHPSPEEVLVIGLSSGSWAQVIVNHPQVKKLTIVEINPGYLRLIPQYSEVMSLLRNPKVEIVIDDGRRWLVRNPDKKFDVIVSNTTFHWRAHITNLLSVEFLQLVRHHLKPGGVHFYNTTGSTEAQLTGATVFPYAVRIINCLAVSDSPIQIDRRRWRNALISYRIDGKPVFDLTFPEHRRRLEEVLSLAEFQPSEKWGLESAESIRMRYRGRRLITDDNMGLEWTR